MILDALAKMGLDAGDTRQPIPHTTDDAFRIALVDSLLADPLETPAASEALAALTDDLARAPVRTAQVVATRLLSGVPARRPARARTDPTGPNDSAHLRAALEDAGLPSASVRLVVRLYEACAAYEEAAERLPDDLLRDALEQLSDTEDEGDRDPFQLRYTERAEMLESDAFFERASSLDVGARTAQTLPVLDVVGEWLTAVADSAHPVHRGFVPLRIPTPAGPVVIGTDGTDRHSADALILIDPGGDDVYPEGAGGTGLEGGGVRIVIDLGGNDLYQGKGPGSVAAGVGGVGVLVDVSGDDTYRAGRVGLGAGVMGLGVLVDLAGDDIYDGESFGQGAGFLGVGMLLERGGNDLYRLGAFGQGYGSVAGLGVLRDYAGGDRYVAAPAFTDVIRYEDHHISFLQGAAFGSRPDRSGGIGLLIDDAGNDTYQSDIFGQGVAYWFGLGALLDRGGHDVYAGYQYSHGAGVHLAVGLLLDDAGEDLYTARGVSQGCGHDLAAGLLVDRAGNDAYVSVDLSQGAGSANGFGVLLDVAGEDAYVVRRLDNSMGYGNPRRGTGSIGVFIDGRGSDAYAQGQEDGTTWWGSQMGSGFDRPFEMTREEAWPEDPPVPVEARDYDDEELFVLATTGPPKFREIKEDAKRRLAERGEKAMPTLLAYMDTRIPRERHGLKDIFVEMGELSVPFLVSVLDTGSARARREAAWSLGYVGSPRALPDLEALLDGEDPALRVEGAMAIAIIARSDSTVADRVDVAALARTLDDADPNVRRAGTFALGALVREAAVPALARALDDPFFSVRLSAVSGFERLGDSGIDALAARVLARGGSGRVFALMGLERLGVKHARVLDALVPTAGDTDAWPLAERIAFVHALSSVASAHPGAGGADAALERLALDPAWEVASVARNARTAPN